MEVSGLPKLVRNGTPPCDYYANNLLALITDVENQYASILSQAELDFGRRVRDLGVDSRRLYARIVSRGGPYLRTKKLKYAEVASCADALSQLCSFELVDWCPSAEWDQLLSRWSVAELRCLFPDITPTRPKNDYVTRIVEHYNVDTIVETLQVHDPWVAPNFTDHLALYRLLFFGDPHQDLSTFVLRDLGVFRFEAYELPEKRRLFVNRRSLDTYLELMRVAEVVHELGPRPDRSAISLLPYLWNESPHRLVERRRSRTLNRLARGFERTGELDAALRGYARSSLAPARERRVRILRKLGDTRAVNELADEMVRRPWTALEGEFARRIANVSVSQPHIPQTDVRLFGSKPDSIELFALAQLTEDFGTGWHLENQFPMGLFALAFWDWIYAPVDGVFVNAFQSGPIDLFWPDFFAVRQSHCEDPLECTDSLSEKLVRTHRDKNGITNRLINWSMLTHERLERIVEVIDASTLCQILSLVREGLEESRAGFPDLTVLYGPGQFEFVEVKGPGDRVQSNQQLWMRRLIDHDIPVRVMRFSPT